jgi:predicted acetyltransferase
MNNSFKFLEPGPLIDHELTLVLVDKLPADPVKKYMPCYEFEMRHSEKGTGMGFIRLRIGTDEELKYPGHIGYEVNEPFRGHRFAGRSTVLLKSFAKEHGLGAVWLTVDPSNLPSQKTCLKIGAEYVETATIPEWHRMYAEGARLRRRYRLAL